MTLRDLIPGLVIQVSCPPPKGTGKHWMDAYVLERTKKSVHVALVGHPAWAKHYIGLVLNKRDLDAGLARVPAGVPQYPRCPSCGKPTHASESNDAGTCELCMRDRGLYPIKERS